MERYIRSLKTRYRRISGRKNWNAYQLHYGSCIVYYDWIEQEYLDPASVARMLGHVGHQRWRQEQRDQLKMYRLRHKRERYLLEPEAR